MSRNKYNITLLSLLFLMFLFVQSSFAATYYVKKSIASAGNGSSWAAALGDLQAVLSASVSGDTIYVAEGTYYPGAIGDDRNTTFQLKNGVAIYGGFPNENPGPDTRNILVYKTVMSGDLGVNDEIDVDGNPINRGDNAYHVFYHPDDDKNINDTAILDGFIITGGNADGTSPHDMGGGMFNDASSPTISNCWFKGNTASSGAGIYNNFSTPALTSVIISNNTAVSNGGGISNNNSSHTLTNCTLSGNIVTGTGTDDGGGGIFNYNSSPIIKNAILWNNTADNGAEIKNIVSSIPSISYSDIENSITDTVWDTVLGAYDGGNINEDPLFLDSENHDYHLSFTSPCKNSGDSSAVAEKDIDGEIRPAAIDIGADEFIDTDEDFLSDYEEIAIYNTLPGTPDSDGDGKDDGVELLEWNKISPGAWKKVYDTDGTLNNLVDYDADGDGLSDGEELDNATFPSHPYMKDSDNDGLDDDKEIIAGTDPLDPDSDDDGFSDNIEIQRLSDPKVATSICPLYVDALSVAVTPDGRSWTTAFKNLHGALTAADTAGDQIWVARGSYSPSELTDDSDTRTATFQMKTGVTIYGGFAGTETTANDRNWKINGTILTGEANNSYHVIYNADLNNTAILDGFTISGGSADGTVPHDKGGAIFNSESSPLIRNTLIINNSAVSGGGIYNYASSPTLVNCTFTSNTANTSGGGITNISSSDAVITNCTFTGNEALSGSAIYNESSAPVITNSILWNNDSTTNQEIANSDSTPVITYSNIKGGGYPSNGIPDASGNMSVDPLFVPEAGGGVHLKYNSPCINKGNNAAIPADTTDIDADGDKSESLPFDFENESRVAGETVDIGADEYVDGDSDNLSDFEETDIHNSDPALKDSDTDGISDGNEVDRGSSPTDGSSLSPIYVNHLAAGDNSGSSWQNACTSLQEALEKIVTTPDQIRVAKGTYYPSALFDVGDPRSASFQMKNDVSILGGFEVIDNAAGPRNPQKHKTILSGNIDSNNDDDTGNSYHIFYHPTELALNDTAILDGFIISGGNADSDVSPHNNGGGMLNISATPTLKNCTFTGNAADQAGGALYTESASEFSIITNSVFTQNTAASGAGIFNVTAATKITHCTLVGNTATDIGGGLFNENAAPVILNSILWNNTAGTDAEIHNTSTETLAIITYSIIEGGYTGTGNINQAPVFVDAAAADFHLKYNSPGVNAGDNTDGLYPITDFENETRPDASGVDMGADEYTDSDSDNLSDYEELEIHNTLTDTEDSDGDGLNDGDEVHHATNPTDPDDADSDNDGLSDGDELNHATNPTDPNESDSDGDGLKDGEEVNHPTDPTDPNDKDSDDDGFNDWVEIKRGSDPNDPDSICPIYVDIDVKVTDPDGFTWATAFSGLQDALDAAGLDGDQIWVATGTYLPSDIPDNSGSNRNKTFQMKNNVKIYGGFNGTETDLSQRNWKENVTTISGDLDENDAIDNTGKKINIADNVYHLFYHTDVLDLDETAVLDGFTLTAGNADTSADPHDRGGAIYNDESSPTIQNCTFYNNYGGHGGAVYNTNSSAVFSNCLFLNNEAKFGGAVKNALHPSTFVNCIFKSNKANENGGALYNTNASSIITNATFYGNESENGGAVYNHKSSPVITNNTFSGNSATAKGGAIYNAGSSPVISNTILWQNSAVTGAEIFNIDIDIVTPVIISNPVISYSNIDGCFDDNDVWIDDLGTDGDNNISSDPLFIDSANGELHLKFNSPCIDMGNDTDGAYPTTDIDGETRPVDIVDVGSTTVDIGADEFVDTDGDNLSDYEEGLLGTKPDTVDSDGDGINDGEEVNHATNPTDPTDGDSDDDGLSDGEEVNHATNPTDPNDSDSDDDGLSDSEEVNHANPTDPNDSDSDDDGLSDKAELDYINLISTESDPTNPNDKDSDNDGFSDGVEVVRGTEPNDSTSICPIFVNINVTGGTTDGSTWTDAYNNLQTALESVTFTPDQIWVAEGTYVPAALIDDADLRSASFSMIKEVKIYGGFKGIVEENIISMRKWKENPTILSGDIGETGIAGDNSYHVIYNPDGTDLDNTSVLDGFTITDSKADAASPHNKGGGMFNENVSPLIVNCVFTNNNAESAAGMYNTDSSPALVNCTFNNNTADEQGGGLYNSNSSPTFTNCSFIDNTATNGAGGGIRNSNSTPVLINCTFTGNTALTGGGIYNFNSSPVITNCIMWGDSAQTDPEISNTSDTSEPVITYSNITGAGYPSDGTSDINSNISADPLFVPGPLGGIHLKYNSLCRNKGNNEALPTDIADINSNGDKSEALPYDYENEARVADDLVDMGSDEYIDSDSDNLSDYEEKVIYGTCHAVNPDCENPSDTDGDGLNDGDEVNSHNTDPFIADSDNDGLEDGDEIHIYDTDPNNPDSDGDGYLDGVDEGVTPLADELWVNGDWVSLNPGDDADGHLFGLNAFSGIQQAMDMAQLNAVIHVAEGHYTENITWTRGLQLIGDGPATTVIDGSNTASVISASNLLAANNSLLKGFTLINGSNSNGGGIYSDNSDFAVQDCIFRNNVADVKGGALYCTNKSTVIMTGCVMTGNEAGFFGGAVSVTDETTLALTNCTVSGNNADVSAGAIYAIASYIKISGSILWNNQPEEIIKDTLSGIIMTFSNAPTLYEGEGNISAEPLFADEKTGDLHLRINSPCINAGNPAVSGDDELDIDGEERVTGSVVDMGADEYLDTDVDLIPDYWEEKFGISEQINDPDNDRLSNREEYYLNTDPNADDSDGNGTYDGDEDFDGDGIDNGDEFDQQMNPMVNELPSVIIKSFPDTFDEAVTVTLDGSSSNDIDDGIASWEWAQVLSEGSTRVEISNADNASASFISPQVNAGGEALKFRLTVTDVSGQTSSKECVVNVSWDNLSPIAEAGESQEINGGDIVELNGSASTDPDGEIGTWLWEQLAGPAVELSDPAVSNPSFTAPFTESDAELEFSLTVTDAESGLTMIDTVTITVISSASGASGPEKSDNSSSDCFINTMNHSSDSGTFFILLLVIAFALTAIRRNKYSR